MRTLLPNSRGKRQDSNVVRASRHVSDGLMTRLACAVQPLAPVQYCCGARRKVFFDFGVVVGEDSANPGVGFGAVVHRVAGRDHVWSVPVLVDTGFKPRFG